MLFQLAIITAAALMGLAYQTPFMDQPFPPLPLEQVSSYSPYTYFAAAAQCEAAALKTWACGGAYLTRPFLPHGRKCGYNSRGVGPEASTSLCSKLRSKSQFQCHYRWRRRKYSAALYARSPDHEIQPHGYLHADTIHRVCGLRPGPRHSHCSARGDRFQQDVSRSESFGVPIDTPGADILTEPIVSPFIPSWTFIRHPSTLLASPVYQTSSQFWCTVGFCVNIQCEFPYCPLQESYLPFLKSIAICVVQHFTEPHLLYSMP